MRKRWMAGMVALLWAVSCFGMTAQAAGARTYELDALELRVDIPEGYGVFTRDTPADDPVYKEFGSTKADMDALLSENDIFLDAVAEDRSHEIQVTMCDSPLTNFSELGDTILLMLTSAIVEVAEDYGITYTKTEVYHHGQVNWIKMYSTFQEDTQTLYRLQYYTVCNAQAITIILRTYTEADLQAWEAECQAIVDSADFWGMEPLPEPAATEPFPYTDPKTGVSFTVPANWEQGEPDESHDLLEAKFVSVQDRGLSMMYSSVDVWAQMSDYEKVGWTRRDMDSDIYQEADIAEIVADEGVEDAVVSRTQYGGKSYFLVEWDAGSLTEMNISIPMTMLARVENGYMYMYMFAEGTDHPYFRDFIQMVSSVQYPELEEEAPSGVPDSMAFGVATLLLVVSLIAGVAVLLWARGKKPGRNSAAEPVWSAERPVDGQGQTAEPSAEEAAPQGPAEAQEDVIQGPEAYPQEPASEPEAGESERPKLLFCHKCGSRLPPEGMYCVRCGAKIPDEGRR